MLWSFETGRELPGSAALGRDGTIYVGSHDNFMYAVRPGRRAALEVSRRAVGSHSSPTIGADDTVYFASYDGHLYAATPDGKIKWRFRLDTPVESSPALGPDGTIYLGNDDKHLYAITPDGQLRWKFPTGDLVVGCPAVGRRWHGLLRLR